MASACRKLAGKTIQAFWAPSARRGHRRPVNLPRGPARQSVLPEASEPVWRQLGVAHGVLDVLVAEVMLQRSRIDTLVCQLEAAGMAQHVRMYAKPHLGGLTEPLQHAAKADRAHGCPALAMNT